MGKDFAALIFIGGASFLMYFFGWLEADAAFATFGVMILIRFLTESFGRVIEKQDQILENQLIMMGKSESVDEEDY